MAHVTVERPTELLTARLRLRRFTLDDVPRVTTLCNDVRVADTVLSIAHPYEPRHAEQWIASHESLWNDKRDVPLAIEVRDGSLPPERALVGSVGLMIKMAMDHAELGYWVGVDHWNTGYCSEAARALVDWGFRECGLHRIFAHHMTKNPASGRVREKLGMRREGLLRGHIKKGDEHRDVVLYAILREEWTASTLA
jgi:RimJ/RimL family protein N-acetyltransferase